jgi:hypothetical protein
MPAAWLFLLLVIYHVRPRSGYNPVEISRQSNVIKKVLKNEIQIDLHQYKPKKHNNMYLERSYTK